MCYAYPGPRCSAHAAKMLTRAQIACQRALHQEYESREAQDKEFDRLMARRTKAEQEFNATPAGMAILRQQIEHEDGYLRERAKDALAQAKALRAHRLKLISARDKGDINDHATARLSNLYNRMGLTDEFETTGADRIGWDADTDQFERTGNLMVRASEQWVKNMTPEQVAAIRWVTGSGSEVLSRFAHGHELGYHGRGLDEEELKRRANAIDEAFDRAPKMPKPVVLYRGIGSQFPFDTEQVIKDGHYTAPSILSATVNPGVANSFGYGNIIIEMKTRRFASPSAFSGAGPREAEVMIRAGSRFRVTGVLRDVTFGWSEKNKVPGYTVIQMEEIEP